MPFLGWQSCGGGNRLEDPEERSPVEFSALLRGEQKVRAIGATRTEPGPERSTFVKQRLTTVRK
jgi:hypothetical protein